MTSSIASCTAPVSGTPIYDAEKRADCRLALLPPQKPPSSEPRQISWDGPDDPENPMNWSFQRKWVATILVSCFTFISPFSSTMVTPALDSIGQELGIAPGFSQALVMSIFLLGYAQGPFVLAPLSEMFGRVPVLQYANLIYLAFNTACGFSQSRSQLLAFRFLSGIGGSAPQAVFIQAMSPIK